jgi:hypothetical protein
MNAVERGAQLGAAFIADGHIQSNREITSHLEDITLDQLMDIGNEVARHLYRSQESIEDFSIGWVSVGLQHKHRMRDGSLTRKETHVEKKKTMPSNVIPFRTRR